VLRRISLFSGYLGIYLYQDPFSGAPDAHYAELSQLFEKYLKRPVRRARKTGWEAKLSVTEATDLQSLRTCVDDLEEEYERISSISTLESLQTARVDLIRRTAFLQRRVADQLIQVIIVCAFRFNLLFPFVQLIF
jgi:hypothetical protein